MIQEYDKYTEEDFNVWKILYDRQIENLKGRVCGPYLDCLHQLGNTLDSTIPRFSELDKKLEEANGWTIKVVPGLIPINDFFELLSRRRFCSSTWLRKMSQLDYLEEPDMFHDIFGHIPLFMDEDYANYAQSIGELGLKYVEEQEKVKALQRLYWYTIEFGLMKGESKPLIYGAGIISSYGETNHIYEDDITILDFDMEDSLKRDFINSEIQTLYYEIDSFADLYKTIDEVEHIFKSI